MVQRTLPKAPLEFYGISIFSRKPLAGDETCPFLLEAGINRKCDKIRKSQRDVAGELVTIGTCVAEQSGKPVILSPWRMFQGLHVFQDAASNLASPTWAVVPEV